MPDIQKETKEREANMAKTGRRMSPATCGTMESVVKRKRIVDNTTCATNAENEDTEERSVKSLLEEFEGPVIKKPKYLEQSVWGNVATSPPFSPTARSTLTDIPLPRPPPE